LKQASVHTAEIFMGSPLVFLRSLVCCGIG
jgi:hypothetical protein